MKTSATYLTLLLALFFMTDVKSYTCPKPNEIIDVLKKNPGALFNPSRTFSYGTPQKGIYNLSVDLGTRPSWSAWNSDVLSQFLKQKPKVSVSKYVSTNSSCLVTFSLGSKTLKLIYIPKKVHK